MKVGIVGSEAAKFTPSTESMARAIIRGLINGCDLVISGHCHLGGIDIWAVEEAEKLGIPTLEFPPAIHKWNGGYMQRNLQIARTSDVLVCIAVKELPEHFNGRRFTFCYHCKEEGHVKSGGCWTMKEAKKLGKETFLVVV